MTSAEITSLPKTVLFLCTGNYYRSRFAELFFNALAEGRSSAWRASSRGLRLNPGNPGPISQHAVDWLQQHGIPLPDIHRFPLPLSANDLEEAHVVVAVKEMEHRPLLEQLFPVWASKVRFWHIHDLDAAPAEEALAELAAQVED